MFDPEVWRCDAEGADIKFRRCPLTEAWQAAGVADTGIAKLCRIAVKLDDGTLEGAGFAVGAATWPRANALQCARRHGSSACKTASDGVTRPRIVAGVRR